MPTLQNDYDESQKELLTLTDDNEYINVPYIPSTSGKPPEDFSIKLSEAKFRMLIQSNLLPILRHWCLVCKARNANCVNH